MKWACCGRAALCAVWLTLLGTALAADAPLRTLRYTPGGKEKAIAWQSELRGKLAKLLKIDDLLAGRAKIALDPREQTSEPQQGFDLKEIEINSTPTRRIKVLVGLPRGMSSPCPAVVCIHGHSARRSTVYDAKSAYRGFARALAERGYVVIAADVGQHKVYEAGRTLMGERLWDLMRCVDYLQSLPQVDRARIGCAGLSLGGEMAMWLGAMDERVAATVSAGFLTRMHQMEKNHCLCWKFDGLRELVDFADIYTLIAPRALLCQNGLKEPATQFPVALAADAMREISLAYFDFNAPQRAALVAHAEGHVIHLPSLLAFFAEHLTERREPR